MRREPLILTTLFMCAGLCARAAVIRVSAAAPGPAHDGASWPTAFTTVSAGLAAATSGDEVWVAQGSYKELVAPGAGIAMYGGFAGTETERGQRDAKENVTALESAAPTGYPIIVSCFAPGIVVDGFAIRGGYRGVAVTSGSAVIAGNTISGARADGDGVWVSGGTAELTGNVISSCQGAAVRIDAALAAVSGNTITGNGGGVYTTAATDPRTTITGNTISGQIGPGMRIDGGATISGNTISGNGMAAITGKCLAAAITGNALSRNPQGVYVSGTATVSGNVIYANDAGVQVDAGSLTVTGNVFYSNSAGIKLVGGTLSAANNTLVHNTHGITSSGTLTAANNIVAFGSGVGVRVSGGSVAAFVHNDVYGNAQADYAGYTPAEGDGNLSADPILALGYLAPHVQPDSPCLDAGLDSAAGGATDLDGQPRSQGAHVDIGADESDGTTWPAPPVRAWRVSPAGNDASGGASWTDALKTITEALRRAQPGDEVWLAEGTYVEQITIPPGVALYGGFTGTEEERGQRDPAAHPSAIDDGTDLPSVDVVKCLYDGTVLDGLVIQNGGVGVYLSSGVTTLRNCTITGNRFGVYADATKTTSGTVRLFGSRIRGNTTNGMVVNGSAAVVRGTEISHNTYGALFSTSFYTTAPQSTAELTGNDITANASYGVSIKGLVRLSSNRIAGNGGHGVDVRGGEATLLNNTIAANTAGLCVYSPGVAGAANNIIAFNSGTGVLNSAATLPVFSHNDTFGNATGDFQDFTPPADRGNFTLDPLFASRAGGDYHLQAGSPCIDTGDDTAVAAGATDMDGSPRIQGAHVDIGAYETEASVTPLADAALALRAAAGLAGATPARLDAVADQRVDVLDAVALIRRAFGLY